MIKLMRYDHRDRENSDPSETAQNEHNNKPTALLVPGDRINDITWRGSKCLFALQMTNVGTTHIVI